MGIEIIFMLQQKIRQHESWYLNYEEMVIWARPFGRVFCRHMEKLTKAHFLKKGVFLYTYYLEYSDPL